ncbi:MAG: hypothetical protein M3Q71_18035, partial [Chloroflexota bacterium]|nr:hypothetical protein [Chloroflexota bacterium]
VGRAVGAAKETGGPPPEVTISIAVVSCYVLPGEVMDWEHRQPRNWMHAEGHPSRWHYLG